MHKRTGSSNPNYRYTDQELFDIAALYSFRSDFQKNDRNAYAACQRRSLLDSACSHMKLNYIDWNFDLLKKEANKYGSRTEFARKSSAAYSFALRHGFLDLICSNMKKTASTMEIDLFLTIKEVFPSAVKYKTRKVSIQSKPHIKGFEIDIFIPELKKGIEFDGKYWHSFNKMRQDKRKENWPDSDILNYNLIKDNYFLSKDIELLHISEFDWCSDKQQSLQRALNFLRK